MSNAPPPSPGTQGSSGASGRLAALRIVPAIAAALLLAVTTSTALVVPLVRTLAIVAIVLSVIVAFVPKRADVRTHASVVLGIVAVSVTGLARTGLPYQIGCGLFVLVVLAALRTPLVIARMETARRATSLSAKGSFATGPASRRAPPSAARAWNTAALIFGVGVLISGALIAGLPSASAVVERQVQRLAGNVVADDDHIGFATTLRVGALRHALGSDRVVMRIKGEQVEYLRGVVLDRYVRGVWSSDPAEKTVPLAADAPEERTTTRIEMSRAALSAHTPEPRWFLPIDACDVRTASGRMSIDTHGSAHPDPPNDTRRIAFGHTKSGSCAKELPPRSEPNGRDLEVVPDIRAQLEPLAKAWTSGFGSQRQVLESIVRELARFEYSLDGSQEKHQPQSDPVVRFLTRDRRGHCELFASAMALMARSAGIPTRIVVGYHVDEYNPITGLGVVRDRNAHSWVEAWVDGRWESFDPTPPSELALLHRPSGWNHFTEALSLVWDRTIGFFAGIGLAGTGIASGVLAVVLILVRRFTQRAKWKKTSEEVVEASRPLPAFETLATALASAGWARTASEPLERFARRLDSAGEPWSADVAEALDRYAELRYGGIGEERTVAQRLDDVAKRIAPAA